MCCYYIDNLRGVEFLVINKLTWCFQKLKVADVDIRRACKPAKNLPISFFQVRVWDVNEGKCIKELEVLWKNFMKDVLFPSEDKKPRT